MHVWVLGFLPDYSIATLATKAISRPKSFLQIETFILNTELERMETFTIKLTLTMILNMTFNVIPRSMLFITNFKSRFCFLFDPDHDLEHDLQGNSKVKASFSKRNPCFLLRIWKEREI